MHEPFAEFAALLLICALVGALFVRLRQPVLIAYIVVGVLVGPAVFGLVTAHDQIALLGMWQNYLESRLQRPVSFVQRGSYREIVDLVRAHKLDFAWVCGYPFVRYRKEMTLVAVPLWRGQPTYQSYVIVPADDTGSTRLSDLRGKVFAYSDPDSNSGYLYPRYVLTTLGEAPDNFFARSFFTWAHRKVVEAVGVALADGGAVDGYVWETLAESNPELTRRLRTECRHDAVDEPRLTLLRREGRGGRRRLRPRH